MSDGMRQGVLESLPLLEVDTTDGRGDRVSEPQSVEQSTAQRARDNTDQANSGRGRPEEQSSDDDEPLLQELEEELERTTFWESGYAQQHLGETTGPPTHPQSYTSRIAVLMDKMDEEQKNRFEAFRRSTLSRSNMKKLVSSLVHQTLNDEKVSIVLCSLGKMFVGDLIESARRLANEENHAGALTRSQVFQAYRMLRRNKKLVKRSTARFFGNL